MRTLFSLLLSLPLSLAAATFPVTTVADSGPGSLRQAILDVNRGVCSPVEPCRIVFAIPGPVPQPGWFTIAPQSPLPVIDRSPLEIDGNSQQAITGDTNPLGPEIELDGMNAGNRSGLKAWATYSLAIQGLAINRFQGHGIFVDSGTNTRISGNYVGIDPTGMLAKPNGLDGIALRNAVGSRIDFNVVSGNRGNGIYLGAGRETSISANRVGVAARGEAAIPNGASGIDAIGSSLTIDSNVVSFNTLHGISLTGTGAVLANQTFQNGLLGIANGFAIPGGQQPSPPTLTSATENSSTQGYYTGFPVVRGHVQSTPETDVVVAAYATPRLDANGTAEGKLYIGRTTVHTDARGEATFEIQRDFFVETLDLFGGWVTATAQPVNGSTSQFSAPIPITITTPTFEVTNDGDAGAGSLREAVTRVNSTECTVEHPCRITFNVSPDSTTLHDGAVRIALQSPLPPIRGYVRVSGASQTWWHGDTNGAGPEVEVRGGDGLEFGTPAEPVTRAYLHAIIVNASSKDGVTIHSSGEELHQISQARIIVSEIYSGTDATGRVAVPNAGSGVRLTGGENSTFLNLTNVRLSHSLLSGNRQHGVSLGGEMHLVDSNRIGIDPSGRPMPNGDDGVHVTQGVRHALSGNVIAFNSDDGVATDAGVRAPSVVSNVYANGGLGIDVHSDGISPADGNNDDGTIDPPRIDRAYYDSARDLTIVEGVAHPNAEPLAPRAFDGAGDRFGNVLFISSEPDPSGRGEGEQLFPTGSPPLMLVEGSNGNFRIGLRGDYRGKWFTATTNRFYCYYEFGCTSRESSEFGPAIQAK